MKQTNNRKWIVLMLTLLAAVPGLARADTPPDKPGWQKFLEQDYLLGSWGGARPWLSQHGADFEFFYIGSMPSIVSGGREIEKVYQGLFLMSLDLDSKKLAGYEGGRFHVASLWLHGEKPFSDRFIGDLNKVNLIDYPNALRLWELWYEQKFLENRVGIKGGFLAIDQDFIHPEVSERIFINQTFFYPTILFDVFDIPGYPVGRHGLPSSPLSSPGLRLRWDPDPRWFAQAAIYDGNPDMSSSGTRINLNNQEGALAYAEGGYRWNQGKEDRGLPGNAKIGGWYHTDDFYDNFNTIRAFAGAGPGPTTHAGNYGLYTTVDQVLFRESGADDPAKQGLGAFARGGWSAPDRNLVEWALDGGLVYRGLIPSRDWDALGVSAAWMWMSRDIARGQRVVNGVAPGTFVPVDYEGLFELTYKAQLTAWWTLQPSVEWAAHPGGSSAERDAWVVVLMTTLRF